MMKLEDLPVVEAPADCVFRSLVSLLDHVEKHVLKQRRERWHQLFPQGLIDLAREEYDLGKHGPHLRRLADIYQREAAAELHRMCNAGEGHEHVARFVWEGEGTERRAVSQTIRAWCREKKCLLRQRPMLVRRGYTTIPYERPTGRNRGSPVAPGSGRLANGIFSA